MADSWRVTLPCTRGEAERLKEDVTPLALLDAPPVLMTSEHDPTKPDQWRLDAYFSEPPGADMLAMLAALVPSAAQTAPAVERVEDDDWVTISQAGLEPIEAGRFFVHTPPQRGPAPAGALPLENDARRAVGPGPHQTPSGG